MEELISFGKGPLFRLSYVLMILGMSRIVFLSLVEGIRIQLHKVSDHHVKPDMFSAFGLEFALVLRLWKRRPINSLILTIFHFCLILVALFLPAHVYDWHESVGFSWKSIPQNTANILTITVLVCLVILLVLKLSAGIRGVRFWRKGMLWLTLLTLPCLFGFICSNVKISPYAYQVLLMLHIYSGNLILLLIPFSPIAMCIVMPLSNIFASLGKTFSKPFIKNNDMSTAEGGAK